MTGCPGLTAEVCWIVGLAVGMPNLAFVPERFVIPRMPRTDTFGLKPLARRHNAPDFAAWTASIEHIRAPRRV